jgi:hypothetical protein
VVQSLDRHGIRYIRRPCAVIRQLNASPDK